MKFWDSSAILSLVAAQPAQNDVRSILDDDPSVLLWWGTRIELASGLCRLHREGTISSGRLSSLLRIIEQIADDADEVEPTESVRITATRILRVHNLRAADAMQLAAALAWTNNSPSKAGFVCLDVRLREAAEKEGFETLP